MHPKHTPLIEKAKTWFSSSLFNRDRAGEYFEYLVEGLDPLWSLTDCKAQITDVIVETADTKTWVMRPTDRWSGFVAGQHAHFTFSVNGAQQTRTFTLSSSPRQLQQEGTISITVKRVPNGRITGWMHDHLQTGDIVTLSQAQGDFVLQTGEPVGYLAAGSGITPIMSQLLCQASRQQKIPSTLVYFANTGADFIFDTQLKTLAQTRADFKCHFVASQSGDSCLHQHQLPQQPICADHIQALLENNPQHIFLCGPHGFREAAKSLLRDAGFNLEQVREEAFGLPPVKREAGAPVSVHFSKSALDTSTNTPGSLLDMADGAGLNPVAGCRMGICHTCKCKKTSGQVRNLITGELSGNGHEDIQICISTPVTDVEIEL